MYLHMLFKDCVRSCLFVQTTDWWKAHVHLLPWMRPLLLTVACLTVFITTKLMVSRSGTSKAVARDALATALLTAKANKARLAELEDTFSYCAACLVVKNQNADLREWVDYHQTIGISRYF
jgi:hypothetical protein